MLNFTDKIVGIVNVPTEITEDDVCNIIVSSFEGGSNYWMGLNNSAEEWQNKPQDEPLATWATKLLLEGKEIKLYDIEEETSEIYTLTLKKLLNGIKLNAINRPQYADKENWDATDADCIMQYALFQDVIYG